MSSSSNISRNHGSANGHATTDPALGVFCEIAAWAAQHRCREIFDACGEIFDKYQVEVETHSELGMRLVFFDLDNQVNTLQSHERHAFEALLKAVDNLVGLYS
jgi:hypothetical protein